VLAREAESIRGVRFLTSAAKLEAVRFLFDDGEAAFARRARRSLEEVIARVFQRRAAPASPRSFASLAQRRLGVIRTTESTTIPTSRRRVSNV